MANDRPFVFANDEGTVPRVSSLDHLHARIRKACKLSSERPNVLGVLRRTVLLSRFYQQYRLVVLLAPKLNRLIHEPRNDLSQRFGSVI